MYEEAAVQCNCPTQIRCFTLHAPNHTVPHFHVTIYTTSTTSSFTYDHRRMKTGHPVRSGVLKHSTGCVVVGWVTTSEFQLLYVPISFCFFSPLLMPFNAMYPCNRYNCLFVLVLFLPLHLPGSRRKNRGWGSLAGRQEDRKSSTSCRTWQAKNLENESRACMK